jgi:hypothetical protein
MKDPSLNMGLIHYTSFKIISEVISLVLVTLALLLENIEEPVELSQYSDWLRTGRPGDRGSIPGKGKDFSSTLCVQTGSEAHPTSCTMGTGGPFPGCKARPGRKADHSPHLLRRSRNNRSSNSSPPKRLHGV